MEAAQGVPEHFYRLPGITTNRLTNSTIVILDGKPTAQGVKLQSVIVKSRLSFVDLSEHIIVVDYHW